MEKSRNRAFEYVFAVSLIALGLLLNSYGIGILNYNPTFGSVGTWLIFMGIVIMFSTTLRVVLRKKAVVDERAEFVSAKAMRITFLALIAGAFIIMLIDGIRPITLPYYLFLSYLLCALSLVYTAAYYVLLNRN